MVQLERVGRWNWVGVERGENSRWLYEELQPLNAVIEHAAICTKCGRGAAVLLFDPEIHTEAGMREAAQRLIREARQRLEKDRGNRCNDHNLDWALA